MLRPFPDSHNLFLLSLPNLDCPWHINNFIAAADIDIS
jgi:hypothetical protein